MARSHSTPIRSDSMLFEADRHFVDPIRLRIDPFECTMLYSIFPVGDVPSTLFVCFGSVSPDTLFASSRCSLLVPIANRVSAYSIPFDAPVRQALEPAPRTTVSAGGWRSAAFFDRVDMVDPCSASKCYG